MTRLLTILPLLLLLTRNAGAVARVVTEGIAGSNNIIFVSSPATPSKSFGVGIGTTTPKSALDVAGSIRISSHPGGADRGIIFQDQSVQITAATGGASTSSTNTWTAEQIHAASVTVARFGSINLGTPSATSLVDICVFCVQAQSKDNVTLSSGTLVKVQWPVSGSVSANIIFTSTNVTSTPGQYDGMCGVLMETCVPNVGTCRVGIKGIFRIRADAGGIAATDSFNFSGTAGRAAQDASLFNTQACGTVLNGGGVAANDFFWASFP